MADVYHICAGCGKVLEIEKNKFEGTTEQVRDMLCDECLDKMVEDFIASEC